MSANTGEITYTSQWSVGAVNAQAISFNIPVTGVIINVRNGAEYIIMGNHSSSSVTYWTGPFVLTGVNFKANKTICSILAVAGTITVSAMAVR